MALSRANPFGPTKKRTFIGGCGDRTAEENNRPRGFDAPGTTNPPGSHPAWPRPRAAVSSGAGRGVVAAPSTAVVERLFSGRGRGGSTTAKKNGVLRAGGKPGGRGAVWRPAGAAFLLNPPMQQPAAAIGEHRLHRCR